MIHDPILHPIRTLRKTRMSNSVRLVPRVLVKDTPLIILPPVLHVHGIITDKLELTEAIITAVGPRGGVDYECLAGSGVCELFRSLVGGEADVEGAAVGGLFPRVGWHAEDLTGG